MRKNIWSDLGGDGEKLRQGQIQSYKDFFQRGNGWAYSPLLNHGEVGIGNAGPSGKFALRYAAHLAQYQQSRSDFK